MSCARERAPERCILARVARGFERLDGGEFFRLEYIVGAGGGMLIVDDEGSRMKI